MTVFLMLAAGAALYLLGVTNGGRIQAKAFDDYLEKRRLKQDYINFLNDECDA